MQQGSTEEGIDGITHILSTHAKQNVHIERRYHAEYDGELALLISRRRLERDPSRRKELNMRAHMRRVELKRERVDHIRQRALVSGSL